MRLRRNGQLSLASDSIRSSLGGGGGDPASAVQTGVPEFGDTTVNTKSARRQRRSFLTLDDDYPQEFEGSSRHSAASSFMPSQTDLEEEDYYTSSLLRPRDALGQDDLSSSSPVSATTLGAASISSPASPSSFEDQTQVQDTKPASLQHPDDRDHTAAAHPAVPLRLCASLASIPEADQRVTHSSTAPIARRPMSYYSTRSNSYSGDSAWNTPALTNATSIASSRPTSSAFLTDTDASNRVSVVESSFSGNSLESPTIEHSQPKPSLPHSDSHASSLEVLTVNTRLPLPSDRQDSYPSPSNIGLGVTTEDEDEAPAPLIHHASDSSLHVRQLSSGGRQRSQWSTESRSRSSSVAERVERARLSSVTGSLADRGRSRPGSATTPTVRAFGLQNVSTETTSWCLRGIAAEQVVPALNSMMGLNRLTVLDISHCGLAELPLSLQSFTSLKYLDITSNKLSKKSLPAFLASITSLEKLVADCCDLHSLHHPLSTLSSLRTLSLQDNQLKSLPSWLSHLEQLRDLRLDGNPLFGVFADLSKPLLKNATSRKRVSSVTSLAQSMFQPQSSQSSSVQGSPLLSTGALPPAEASPLFGSVRSSRIDVQPTLPARERAQSSAPAINTAASQRLHHPALLHGGVRRMRSSNDVAKDAEQQQQSPQVDTKTFRKSAYAELPSPVRPDLPREDSAPAAPQSAPSQQGPMSPPPSQPQTPPPSAPPQSVRKKTSFFKKMGTFGRSRKDSNKPRHSEESQFTPSPPAVAPAEIPPPVPEKTGVPPSTPQTVLSPPSSRPASVAPISRPQSSSSVASSRTQLRLDQTPPAHARGDVIALNEDESEAEEIYDQSFEQPRTSLSPEQQRAAGLQALLAYLKDLDDLTPRDSLPLHPGQLRPAMSGRNTTSHSSLAPEQAETESTKTSQANTPIDSPVSVSDMKFKVDLAKRESVINEMVATERSYVAGLQELVDIYVLPSVQPVKSASSSSKESIIPLAERKAVFSNIENLLQFHKTAFLPDLEAVIATLRGQRQSQTPDSETNQALLTEVAEELARVFVRHGAFLKMYHIYVNNFDAALTRFQSWTAQSSAAGGHLMSTSKLVASSAVAAAPGGISATDLPPAPTASLSSSQKKRIKAFLQKSRLDPKHSQMNCESYLLMPIQRIPRYRMLLEQLVGCTPVQKVSGLQPNPVLSAALGLASDLANELNEKKRESEGRTRLLYWQARIGNKFKSPLVQPHRLLLKESRMIVSRTVKRSTDFATSSNSTPPHISQSMFQVESLKIEEQHRPLIALLSSDILVLVVDSGSAHGPVELYAVIRLGRTASSQCATACGKNDSTLRVVDPQRAILYLEPGSAVEAHAWAQAINQQAISS